MKRLRKAREVEVRPGHVPEPRGWKQGLVWVPERTACRETAGDVHQGTLSLAIVVQSPGTTSLTPAGSPGSTVLRVSLGAPPDTPEEVENVRNGLSLAWSIRVLELPGATC